MRREKERECFKDANTCIIICGIFNVIVHVIVLVMIHSPPLLVKYTHSVCTSVSYNIYCNLYFNRGSQMMKFFNSHQIKVQFIFITNNN